MWFITKRVLDYLNDKDISHSKKEELVKKKEKKIKREIAKLTEQEIIDFLYHSNIPKQVKILIFNHVEELTDKDKINTLKTLFIRHKLIREDFLKSDHTPTIFKRLIIQELYANKMVETITRKNLSKRIKQTIISYGVTKKEAIKLLASDISLDLKEQIIDECLTDNYAIRDALNEKEIPDDILDKIVVRKVNMDNIFRVIWLDLNKIEERVMRIKGAELEAYIDSIKPEEILDKINNYDTPSDFVKRLYKEKEEILREAIKIASRKDIKETLSSQRIPEIVNLVVEIRPNTIYEIIKDLEYYNLLRWLNHNYLPNTYKEFLITHHADTLTKEINKASVTDITFYYFKQDAALPKSIQKRLFDEHKQDLIDEIKTKDKKQIVTDIMYGSYIMEYRHLLIDLGVDKDNILDVLNQYRIEEILDYLLETKQDTFKEYIESLDLEDILHLRIGRASDEVLNSILEANIDVIKPKLNTLTKEELFKLLDDRFTHQVIKKIILQDFNIDDNDLNNVLSLINIYNTEIILANYTKVKEYITELDINFQSFLQYGSGSKKHSTWLNNLIDIIDNDKEQFKKVKHYFFTNYYDTENENIVYTISSFLELISNYTKYKDLCINLTNNNIELTKEDKLNITFLFNITKVDNIDLPSSLEELSTFKINLYKEYIIKIKNNELDIKDMKSLFNDFLFCNSRSTLKYIGGTGALRTLKKDNQNNPLINELCSELMLYSTITEMVNDTNNEEGLKTLLTYIFSDIKILTKFQNMFSQVERKVLKLYELDSLNNLTTLHEADELENMIDYKRSNSYGGLVYDFSDKNYCLYAHVLSSRENIEDLLNGRASGNHNFISVSPVSYRGQKYYWNRSEVILAYDTIPQGSFICSSISNMGSNGNISKNSSEVTEINRSQRGILETSAVTDNNSEALLYREGLRPCGLILPGGREPTPLELEYHQRYNLPFIITQEMTKAIENPKMEFKQDEIEQTEYHNEDLETIINILKPNVTINKENEHYTGREIALFTDCHSMYEPTLAVLEDIRRHGISEIYSLGDNVGLGPNPSEVFDLLEEYGVVSVAGNSEYYNTLGTKPFTYFYPEKEAIQEWTASQLGPSRINKIKLYPASIDILVGNKKVALCHFANDVRWDYHERSTHTYQAGFVEGKTSKQFLYTNSDESKKKLNNFITTHKKHTSKIKGHVDARNNPIFGGKMVTSYDSIIQGHVHFHMEDFVEDTEIYTLRAVGMGYDSKKENSDACYYVLKETKDGSFEIEKRLVPFNKNSLLSSIYTSGLPHKDKLLSYVKSKS